MILAQEWQKPFDDLRDLTVYLTGDYTIVEIGSYLGLKNVKVGKLENGGVYADGWKKIKNHWYHFYLTSDQECNENLWLDGCIV